MSCTSYRPHISLPCYDSFSVCCTCHGLCPLAYSNSELTSEIMNPFRHLVGLLGWSACPSQTVSLPSWVSMTQENTDIHP